MLAQLPTPTNTQLLNFLLGGTGLLAITYLVLCVWHKGREVLGRNPPVRVEAAEPITLRELRQSVDKLESRLGNLENRIDANFSEWHARRETQWLELHEKIGRVNQSVQRILGRLERHREK